MAEPNSRESFKNYCLQRLGSPLTRINIDPDQIENCIDDALAYWQEFHIEAITRVFLSHQVTEADKNNGWIPLSPLITSVVRLIPWKSSPPILSSGGLPSPLLSVQAQAGAQWTATSFSIISYHLAKQHREMLENLVMQEPWIEFKKHTNRLDVYALRDLPVGQYLILDCYRILNPAEYENIWRDIWLKNYATALIKIQYGTNIKKFGSMQLGGIQLDGPGIYSEGKEEKQALEEELKARWTGTPRFFLM